MSKKTQHSVQRALRLMSVVTGRGFDVGIVAPGAECPRSVEPLQRRRLTLLDPMAAPSGAVHVPDQGQDLGGLDGYLTPASRRAAEGVAS